MAGGGGGGKTEHGVSRGELLSPESSVGIISTGREEEAGRSDGGDAHEGKGKGTVGRRWCGVAGPAFSTKGLGAFLAVSAFGGGSARTGGAGKGGRDHRRISRSRNRGRSTRRRRSRGRGAGQEAAAGRGGSKAGRVSGRNVSKKTFAAVSRVGRGSAIVVPRVLGSVGRTAVVPAVEALTAETVNPFAHRFDPTLCLDCAVRDGDRSVGVDRLEELRLEADGEMAQSINAFDDKVGWADDADRREVGFNSPVGREGWLHERHDWREESGEKRGGVGREGEESVVVESVPLERQAYSEESKSFLYLVSDCEKEGVKKP